MLRAELALPEMFRCVSRSLSQVVPRALAWIWPGWIPRGSLSLVLGEPGVGKSLCALQLAAMVTRGWSDVSTSSESTDAGSGLTEHASGQTGNLVNGATGAWPSAQNAGADQGGGRSGIGMAGTPGTVVLFEAGDGASILRTRLEAAGADVERIVLVERNWRGDSDDEVEEFLQEETPEPVKRPGRVDKDRELQRDLESLELHVMQLRRAGHDVSLVIIDPIESLLRDSLDKYRLARILSELADSLNVAIVAVGTTSSTPRAYPGLRIDGKGIDALFKACNTVMTVARDLDDDQRRVVLPTKLNLSAPPPGLTFGFAGDGSLEWSQAMTPVTGQDYLVQQHEQRKIAAGSGSRQDGSGKELNRAMTWLMERLSHGGVPMTTVQTDANEQQISKGTLRRAFNQLGGVSKKSRGAGQWVWRLPESADEAGDSGFAESSDTTTHHEAESGNEADRINGFHSASAR